MTHPSDGVGGGGRGDRRGGGRRKEGEVEREMGEGYVEGEMGGGERGIRCFLFPSPLPPYPPPLSP